MTEEKSNVVRRDETGYTGEEIKEDLRDKGWRRQEALDRRVWRSRIKEDNNPGPYLELHFLLFIISFIVGQTSKIWSIPP
jgi:hypothetical protein